MNQPAAKTEFEVIARGRTGTRAEIVTSASPAAALRVARQRIRAAWPAFVAVTWRVYQYEDGGECRQIDVTP